ncbi:hypothetical protein Zmor_027316 [Zophobas morio]|uniref:WAP domain-containing protein n=1 Tax=Zophobas morio TaxID=2755281 RepID=A0AA38HP33_9CUCU|nr:hypothetical protein Zmor_027316 [Zophobas morio]
MIFKLLTLVLFLGALIHAEENDTSASHPPRIKPGACPSGIQGISGTCSEDLACPGDWKCCPLFPFFPNIMKFCKAPLNVDNSKISET